MMSWRFTALVCLWILLILSGLIFTQNENSLPDLSQEDGNPAYSDVLGLRLSPQSSPSTNTTLDQNDVSYEQINESTAAVPAVQKQSGLPAVNIEENVSEAPSPEAVVQTGNASNTTPPFPVSTDSANKPPLSTTHASEVHTVTTLHVELPETAKEISQTQLVGTTTTQKMEQSVQIVSFNSSKNELQELIQEEALDEAKQQEYSDENDMKLIKLAITDGTQPDLGDQHTTHMKNEATEPESPLPPPTVSAATTVETTRAMVTNGENYSSTVHRVPVLSATPGSDTFPVLQMPTTLEAAMQIDTSSATPITTTTPGTSRYFSTSPKTTLSTILGVNTELQRSACYQRPIIEICGKTNIGQGEQSLAWFYDPVEMTCHSTSDCVTNANAFTSEKECSSVCMPPTSPKRCLAPPKAGYYHCSKQQKNLATSPILMVFFDKTTGKCRWFTYYGCGGTENRFRSIAECEATCSDAVASKIFMVASELCQAPPAAELLPMWPAHKTDSSSFSSTSPTGKADPTDDFLFANVTFDEALEVQPGCSNLGQLESRWFLDWTSGTCKEFAFSHCGGSANNFLTRTDCEQFCGAKKENPADICVLKPKVGECTTYKEMWYFDPEYVDTSQNAEVSRAGGCRTFNYSGCGGNSNRFPTQYACETTCYQARKHPRSDRSEAIMANNTLTTEDKVTSTELDEDKVDPQRNHTLNQSKSNDAPRVLRGREFDFVNLLDIDLEPCRRPAIAGNCRPLNCSAEQVENNQCPTVRFQRWFFNTHTSNCEPFNYSGCGGSENTFDDAQSCQVSCKARIVRPDRDPRCDSLPHQTKCYMFPLSGTPGAEQKDKLIAFHFSMGSATCKAFHLDITRPGCTMEPYFSNGHECLRACLKSTPTEKHLQSRCFARKTHANWNCTSDNQNINRWSYLSELNQCVRFSQCLPHSNQTIQPGNNFPTRAICETTCMATSMEEVCQLPVDPGPCKSTHTRYYYDVQTSKCRMFLYGGCLGNANRFNTREECKLACSEFPLHVMRLNITSQVDDQYATEKATDMEPAPLSAEVFDQMRYITQHHTDHFPWDLCLEGHSYGTCPAFDTHNYNTNGYPFTQLTRYFYDRRLGKCQPFRYTGCGARGNHFDTLPSCTKTCEDRLKNPKTSRCREKDEIQQCVGSGIYGWMFNRSIGDCYSVELCPNVTSGGSEPAWAERLRLRRNSQWLGVWQPNKGLLPSGVYATRSACQYHCLPKPPRGTDAQNVCHMNPIVTVPFGCNAMVTRWYFEPREAACRSYITCPQYGNNFPNEKTCREVCLPTHPLQVCRLPRDHGGYSQFATRWYYNVDERICKPFLYGGSFGNANRFLTKAECNSFCTSQDICRLPLQKNSTDTTYPLRYYYEQNSHRCLPFHFTGILAHGNNFPDLVACNATCLYVPEVEAIAAPEIQNTQSPIHRIFILPNSTEMSGAVETSSSTAEISVGKQENTTLKRSPCATPLSKIGQKEPEKRTVCDVEDIVHELGYRFREVGTKSSTNEMEGVCELTLVPICLSEPRKVYGASVDPVKQTIGRIFLTQMECEETCLSNRRQRRSAENGLDSGYERPSLSLLIDKLVRQGGHDTGTGSKTPSPSPQDSTTPSLLRNGCSPGESAAEQVDKFDHKFQAFSRWPCKFDQWTTRKIVPLIEGLTGESIKLPCWIISTDRPLVKWTRLKDRKTYSVIPIQLPALNNVWMAHLHLRRMDPFRHDGGWICEARSQDGFQTYEIAIQLHVVVEPFQAKHMIRKRSLDTFDDEQLVSVPEGGTVLLDCNTGDHSQNSGYFLKNRFHWERKNSKTTNDTAVQLKKLTGVPLVFIHPVQANLHSGSWSCRYEKANESDKTPDVKFYVEVNHGPRFVHDYHTEVWPVSRHQQTKWLHCGVIDWGQPLGTLTWLHCDQPDLCVPLSRANVQNNPRLLVKPRPGDSYICRVENMWGRAEKRFIFTYYR